MACMSRKKAQVDKREEDQKESSKNGWCIFRRAAVSLHMNPPHSRSQKAEEMLSAQFQPQTKVFSPLKSCQLKKKQQPKTAVWKDFILRRDLWSL